MEARNAGPELTVETGTPGLQIIRGVDRFGRGTVVTFAPRALDAVGADPVPVVATDPYLEATGAAVGDELHVQIAGVDRRVIVVGAIRAFPTVDPSQTAPAHGLPDTRPPALRGQRRRRPRRRNGGSPLDPSQREATIDRLRDPSFGSRSVVSLVERNQALATDPVALGIIGVLSIGVVAAGLFAVVGFVVSAAVSARERVTEFALLRALGLSSGQLSGWLSLENATLAAISLVAGTGAGPGGRVGRPAVRDRHAARGHAIPAGGGGRALGDDRGARGDRHRGARRWRWSSWPGCCAGSA